MIDRTPDFTIFDLCECDKKITVTEIYKNRIVLPYLIYPFTNEKL